MSRISLQRFILNDAPFLKELMNTPGWLQFIGNRQIDTVQAAANYITSKFFTHFNEFGYGPVMLCAKESKLPIGIITVVKRDYLPYPDIGFALLPEFEGEGYAYEGSKVIIEQLTKEFNFPELFAFTEIDNVKSITLIERLGFESDGKIKPEGEDEELLLFKLKITV
jgi:RimJ/RimL family protein N-acetyltransferase